MGDCDFIELLEDCDLQSRGFLRIRNVKSEAKNDGVQTLKTLQTLKMFKYTDIWQHYADEHQIVIQLHFTLETALQKSCCVNV